MLKRWLSRLFLFSLLMLVVAAVTTWLLLRASLPALDGDIRTDGIRAPISISRDEAGIPTIVANDRRDLAFGSGFVHAQDRFFQMDLMRRKAAGELAEMVGPVAVGLDKQFRFHRFRARAAEAIRQMSAQEQVILSAYVDGVNAGLQDLGTRPFEYYLLRATPRPWNAEDSVLVGYAMFLELNDERAARDIQRGIAHSVLPRDVFDWMYPSGTEWDAPLQGSASAPMPVPETDFYVVAENESGEASRNSVADHLLPGSNNWAVSGDLTDSGRAIVANDMHLGLGVPNTFYRASLIVGGSQALELNGVMLPGVPVLVAGSNGRIAWGNTNSYGDWSDAVIVRAGQFPDTYRTPQGDKPFKIYREQIRVKGTAAIELTIRETVWGPVIDDNPDTEQEFAVSWIAHYPEAVNFGQLKLETIATVNDALQIAAELGMPPQNFVVGDAEGNIGWTIAGKIPRRSDYNALLPADWSRRSGWIGWLDAADYPRIVNPPSGRIWTANQRVVDGDALRLVGDGGYDLGARAKQVRDGLFARERFEAKDMLPVQLDDRAIFLERWRDLLLAVLTDQALDTNPARSEYRALVEDWIPEASTGSVGYRLVRVFRIETMNRVFNMLMQPVRNRYGASTLLRISNQFESPLWSLVSEKPPHMLTPDYQDWDELLLQAVDDSIRFFAENYSDELRSRTWGERNTAEIRHPLSRSLPVLGRWLDMPADQLPGDSNLPRAQGPAFGASERFGVAPGDEVNGYLHMPAGQSGHPLSPYYSKGHDDWVAGRASPFLPGEDLHRLELKPAQ